MTLKLDEDRWQLGPGAHIGGWRVVRQLARGGMGEVYVAESCQNPAQKGAIKLLISHHARSDNHLKRFLEEARILRALTHPNVVLFHEAGFTSASGGGGGDCPFLVTELLEGRTLAEVSQAEGRLGIDECLDICAEVADGVHALHEIGVLHRDLKPANIFITTAGMVKVLDFGIAKPFEGPAVDERIAPSTEADMLIGTWQYMSPEQLLGERRLDRATDIFALGALLYELLAGVSPWCDDDGVLRAKDVVARRIVLLDPTPLPSRLRDFPDDVWAVVRQALRKNPEERFRTMAEFADRLRRARSTFLARRGLPQGGAAKLAIVHKPMLDRSRKGRTNRIEDRGASWSDRLADPGAVAKRRPAQPATPRPAQPATARPVSGPRAIESTENDNAPVVVVPAGQGVIADTPAHGRDTVVDSPRGPRQARGANHLATDGEALREPPARGLQARPARGAGGGESRPGDRDRARRAYARVLGLPSSSGAASTPLLRGHP